MKAVPVFGKVTVDNDVQLENASSFIVVTLLAIEMDVNDEQFLNNFLDILVIAVGNVIEDKFVQP